MGCRRLDCAPMARVPNRRRDLGDGHRPVSTCLECCDALPVPEGCRSARTKCAKDSGHFPVGHWQSPSSSGRGPAKTAAAQKGETSREESHQTSRLTPPAHRGTISRLPSLYSLIIRTVVTQSARGAEASAGHSFSSAIRSRQSGFGLESRKCAMSSACWSRPSAAAAIGGRSRG
jgi:hypothetical protein